MTALDRDTCEAIVARFRKWEPSAVFSAQGVILVVHDMAREQQPERPTVTSVGPDTCAAIANYLDEEAKGFDVPGPVADRLQFAANRVRAMAREQQPEPPATPLDPATCAAIVKEFRGIANLPHQTHATRHAADWAANHVEDMVPVPQPEPPATPSAGAMRAARILIDTPMCEHLALPISEDEVAAIIDKHTGLPELLATCRATATISSLGDLAEARGKARATLAKHDGVPVTATVERKSDATEDIPDGRRPHPDPAGTPHR